MLLAAQVVSIQVLDGMADESTMKSATFAISRDMPTASPVLVQLFPAGPALPNTDYTFSSNVTPDQTSPGVYDVIIPGGQSTANVTVTPISDQTSDGVYYNFQTVQLQIGTADPSATVNPSADIADARIYDNDDPLPPSNGYSYGYVNVLNNGSGNQIEPLTTATDPTGDVYVAGTFSGKIDLAGSLNNSPSSNPMQTAPYTSVNSAAAFIAKYDKKGGLLWSNVYDATTNISGTAGTSDAWASSLAVDPSGNVILGGRFFGTLNSLAQDKSDGSAGPSTPLAVATTSTTTNDANFVMKLDPSGTLQWSKTIGGVDLADHGVSTDPTSLPDRTPVAVDTAGNVYVGGDFTGTVSLPDGSQMTSQGSYDFFIAKLNPDGSVAWHQNFGGTGTDALNGIAVDSTGEVYGTGSFSTSVNFGPTQLTSSGVSAFALKLSNAGAVDWAGAMGSTSPNDSAEGNAILTDSSGNAYLTGDFIGTVDFNPAGGNTASSANGDVFIVQLTTDGKFGWLQTPTHSGDFGAIPWGLAQDTHGHLYATGFYSGTMTLGTFGVLGASGQYDTFVARFDEATGMPQWGTNVQGMDGDLATGIAVDPVGNVYIAGNFTDQGPASKGFDGATANFDPFLNSDPQAEESANGSIAGFLWKLIGPPTANMPPTVATPASANPNPVTGTTTNLSVLGADDGGESNLSYTWNATGPGVVTYSINGTNASKNTTATFKAAGTYNFVVTITDAGGLSTTSSVSVVVNQTLTSAKVSPANATLNENGTQQFSATAFDQFGSALTTQPAFTWSLVAPSVGMVDNTGLYTAPAGTGSATVKATSGTVSATASVTVKNAAPIVATPASANPNPVTGTTTNLSVLGADDGGEGNLTYTWATTGTPPAPVTFSANGTNAAKSTTATFAALGSYSFQVTITDSGGLSTTSTVNVTVNPTITTINVTPPSVTLNAKDTKQFSATALDQFGNALATQPSFTWSLKSPSIGMIDNTGLYTAPATGGSDTVQATSGSVTGTASVTVKASAPTVATAASANPNPVTGTTTNLSVLGADAAGESTLTYTWATTGTPPAPVTYSINGTNAAKNTTATFTAAGSYNFQVTITDGSGLTATSNVTVTVNQTFTKISVSPSLITLNENATKQFSASALDQFGSPMTTQPAFTWSLASGSVGMLDTTGLYTAPSSPGSATVQASSGAITGTASVTIKNAAPTVATAASANPNPVTGKTTSLSVLGADDGGEGNLTYTWATTGTPPAPVSFSANGTNASKNTTATFTAAGTYDLQVTITDTGGLTATSTVIVTVNQTVTSINVSPPSVTVNPNATKQFSATAVDQFNTPLTTQPSFTWSLATGSVGMIDNTGLYTAPATAGSATVQATSGSITGTASVTVKASPPTVATPASANPNPVTGTTTNLSVLGADAAGENTLTYTWATTGTPPAPVTYSTNGTNAAKSTTATFTAAGSYNFQVTITNAAGLSVTSNVTVTVNQTLTKISVSPPSITLNENATKQFAATALDQFNNPLTTQPSFTWSLVSPSVGMVDNTGLYTAPASTGSATVKATSGALTGTASVTINNAAPTVAQLPKANPNPVTGTTTNLSVLGADDGGESNLTYTWETIGAPPAPVSFSANGTNASKNATATFTQAGTYNIQVTITDLGGLSTNASVVVTVNQTLTSVSVKPASVTLGENGTQSFSATAVDQFNNPLPTQPAFTWSLAAGSVGMIDMNTGLYTAPASTGTATVQATSGALMGTASVKVISPLTVTAATFEYGNFPPDVSVTFSADVSSSLTAGSLVVKNLTTGATVTPSSLSYDAATNTAKFKFAGQLPDGNYTATLPAASVSDAAGDHLPSDYTLSFFSLAGDINHDRSVNFTDLVVLARNYGKPATYAGGDLNGNGTVDFPDLVILARNYGHTIAAPPATAAVLPTLADDPLTALRRRRHA